METIAETKMFGYKVIIEGYGDEGSTTGYLVAKNGQTISLDYGNQLYTLSNEQRSAILDWAFSNGF